MDSDQSSVERNILEDDPLALLALLDKYVKINLIKNCSYEGFVHSIDPLTKSIILHVPEIETSKIILIPGQSIIDVFDIPTPTNLTPPTRKPDLIVSKEDLVAKKVKLIAWFKKKSVTSDRSRS